MGFFGFIGKALGKVAKAGLSTITHGASDQVIKVLKGRGVEKQVLAKGPSAPATNNEVATVRKLLPAVRLSPDAALNSIGSAIQNRVAGVQGYSKRPGKGSGFKAKTKLLRASSAPKRAKAKGTGRARAPGMVAQQNRMKALAAEWRAAGKPGRWIDYVKSRL